jgi:hypothetical protein
LIKGFFGADMLNTTLPIGTQKIKSQTVCIRIDFIDQFLAQTSPLCRIKDKFKNRILNPLAIIFTRLGHPA